MSVEAVNRIRECEEEAREMRRTADSDAKKVVQKAHEDGQKLVEDSIKRAENKAVSTHETNEAEMKRLSDENDKSIEAETKGLYNGGMAKKKAALELICSEILRKNKE